jgi:hypothetical protein
MIHGLHVPGSPVSALLAFSSIITGIVMRFGLSRPSANLIIVIAVSAIVFAIAYGFAWLTLGFWLKMVFRHVKTS